MDPLAQSAGGARREFTRGAKLALPIVIGMIPSALAFGILAKTALLTLWESLFMSAVVFAGASQFAALNLLVIGAPLVDVLLTTALLNARHIMMGSSLSQRMKPGMEPLKKTLLFFMLTDESFSIASLQKEEVVEPAFVWGVQIPIYLTWTTVTMLGYIGTSILPQSVQQSMGIAIYALFAAIIIPSARKSRAALTVTLCAMALSAFLKWTPAFAGMNRGVVIMLCAGCAAAVGAWLFPKSEEAR